ncbi:putative ABC transport system permease protein [Arthrobacter sp. SLBN-112]|jgi:putative ABC transport system permease protein|uniref:FtsX-like permease family protein n=1 Tax=Arthrobacter sp. SLBN-112 TaxID=2768452 RepID=UPI0011511CE3|nr:FtsX-like permease family protein [Arthrobacter sp. SLBN-112]TQJ39728.1 putative ABC transport system permease protein [Arthrobacter sp. SLBN-112]
MPLDLAPVPQGRRSSYRVALRLARRDIARHRGRSLLIVLLIMLPVAGMTGAATLYQSSQRTPGEIVSYELGNTQARFSVLPVPSADSFQDPLNDGVVASSTGRFDPDFQRTDPFDAIPAGYDVLPQRLLQLTTGVGEALVSLQGREVDALNPAFTGKFSLLAGRAPSGGTEVLASPGLMTRFHLTFGQEFATSAGTFVPVGTIRDAGVSDGNSILYLRAGQVPADLAQGPLTRQSVSYYLVGPDPVTWPQVREANSKGVGVLSRSVVLNPPSREERTVAGSLPRDDSTEAVAIYASFGMIGALALLEVGLLAGAAFAVGAKQQVRELALLASSGAEGATIRAVVTAGGLWLGGLAVAAGAAVGLGAAAVLVHVVRANGSARLPGLHPDFLLTAAAMAMGLASCAIAAMVPARQVSRQAVLGALKAGRAPAAKSRRATLAGAGTVVLAAGLLAAGWVLGRYTNDPDRQAEQLPLVVTLLILGAVLAVVGLVLLTGWLVLRLTSRIQWMPLPLRMAARDSARNRGRSVPAVAAVLAAATLASAALVLSASQQAGLRESHYWGALENQAYLPLVVDPPASADGSRQPSVRMDAHQLSSAVADALGTVESTQVITAPESLRNCPEGPSDLAMPARTATSNCLLYSLAKPAANQCPRTPKGRLLDPGDWRCRGSLVNEQPSGPAILVGGEEDIRAALGRSATPQALAVLNAGGMVVTNPVFVSDGRVLLEGKDVRTHEPASSGPGTVHATVRSDSLAAAVLEPAVPVPYYGVVSRETAERLDLHVAPAGVLVQLSTYPSEAAADAASAAAAAVYGQPGMPFQPEEGISQAHQWITWSIVAAAALITFNAAGITTGLSMADARKDHAVLAGVGASPRLRKALAGSQGLFTSGVGAALGTLAGSVPAVLLALSTDMRTALEVPWLQLSALIAAVPLTAAALAWVFTRPGLPLQRRGWIQRH